VKQDGRALHFTAPALKADREVVLAAVRQNGRALKFASAEMQADREVVLAAVRQNEWALGFASPTLDFFRNWCFSKFFGKRDASKERYHEVQSNKRFA